MTEMGCPRGKMRAERVSGVIIGPPEERAYPSVRTRM
jgi:hypothetical protein